MWLNLMPTRFLFAALVLVTFSTCVHVNKFAHEPSMAAAQAQKFADTAFIERNPSAAYGLLSPNSKAQMSLDQFKDLLSKLHRSQYPSSVEATDYEPLPGQKGMNIFLSGVSVNERFYYRFLMEGTKETDYAVAGVWRNNRPYPPSAMRKPLR
jgi:hypothetical protein